MRIIKCNGNTESCQKMGFTNITYTNVYVHWSQGKRYENN